MSLTKDYAFKIGDVERQHRRPDPFDGDQAVFKDGKELRKETTIESCQLCRPVNDFIDINSLLKETMVFITSCLPQKKKIYE